jgi:hypothetical protein
VLEICTDSLICQAVDSFPGVESKRIADADEAIHSRARQAGPEMAIDLVEPTQLGIRRMHRTAEARPDSYNPERQTALGGFCQAINHQAFRTVAVLLLNR